MVNGNNPQSWETDIQFDPTARSRDERSLRTQANETDSTADLRSREREGQPNPVRSLTRTQSPSKGKGTIVTRFKKTSSAMMISLLVAGATLGVTTITMTPTLGAEKILKTFLSDFDYQTTGSTRIISKLTKSQFRDDHVDCKGAKDCEKLTSINDQEAKTFKQAGIDVEREPSIGSDTSRGRIVKAEYTDQSLGEKIVMRNQAEFSSALARNANFNGDFLDNARNANFITNDDIVARRVLAKHGTSKAPIDGNDEKSIKKAFEDAIEGRKPGSIANSLRPVKDKDGNTVGYTDSSGNPVSSDQVEQARASESKLAEATKLTSNGMIDRFSKGVTRGLSAFGTASTVCAGKSTLDAIGVARDVAQKSQMVRTFQAFGSIVGEWEVSDNISNRDTSMIDKKMEMLGNLLTTVLDNNEMIADPNSPPDNPRFIKNPRYGATGFDSLVFAMSADGYVGKFDKRTQRYTFHNNLSSEFKTVQNMFDKVDPRACKVINNPIVQGAGIALGIASGAITLGGSTAITTGASLAFAMAEPYMISVLADIMTGNLVKGLAGTDLVDAIGIGAQSYQGDTARASGFMPLNKSQATKYMAETKTLQHEYAMRETRRAADTPFDIKNQYSFLGSLARSVVPYTINSSRTVGTTLLSVGGLFSAASSSLAATTHAADYVSEERFSQCDLKKYTDAGIDADMTCLPVFGFSPEAMKIDPVENSIWMRDSGNIKDGVGPQDNGQSWNYKKFVEKCREDKDKENPNAWLKDCSVISGPNKPLNDRFSVYAQSMRLNAATSADPNENKVASNNGSSTNKMSSDGWVFPTTLDAIISSGFGQRPGLNGQTEDHKGIDLAQPSGAMDKPIFAARGGTVVQAGPANGFGNWIVIDHGNNLYTVYGHMKDAVQGGITVSVGQQVRAGDPIGKIGSEGYSSGPHLHFAKWEGGNILELKGGFVDPTADMTKAQQEAKA